MVNDDPKFSVKKVVWPTIYARTNTGAIQVWWIEQEGERYHSVSGQIDGVKTVAADTFAKGKNAGKKNETTSEDQSTKEIKAKYKKQLESGGYWEDVNEIDEEKFFQVMLAKSYEDYRDKIDWSKGVGIQIKYNGGRIIAKKNGLFTRKGERYISIPHIEEALKPFFLKFPDAVLDGEGFNFDLREKLNKIMKLLRKTVHITSQDLEDSKNLIRFYVYDGFGFPACKDGPIVPSTAGYLERKNAIDYSFFSVDFVDKYKDIIHKVPTWIVRSELELENLYQQFLADHQEGAILRILDNPYENKRSRNLLKYKPEEDSEFKIIGVQEGDGKFANRIATFTCQRIDGLKFEDDTDIFKATFAGTEDDAIGAWKIKDSFIGQVVTIFYNSTTGYGKPNFARLKWDNYMHDK